MGEYATYIANQKDLALAVLGRRSFNSSGLGLGRSHSHGLLGRAREASCFDQPLDCRDHRRFLLGSWRAEIVLYMESTPHGDRDVEELHDLTVQTGEVIQVPNLCIVGAETSIVQVFWVQGQFEPADQSHAK